MASPAEVRAYIEQQAKAAGLTPNDIRNLLTTAQKESTMGQNLVNPRSTARGVFQFMPKTGREYGLNGKGFDNRMDMAANVNAGIKFYKDNQRRVAPVLAKAGIPIDDPAAMYLAHNQGAGATRSIYRSLGTGKTINQLTNDEKARENGMDGMTAEQAIAMWGGKANRFAKNLGLSARGSTAVAPAPTPPKTPPTGLQPPPATQPTTPKLPAYLTGETPPLSPPPYAPMTDPLASLLPPPNAPTPSPPAPNMLSSTLMSGLGPMGGIPLPEPEPVTLASITKQVADNAETSRRNTLSSSSVDPMVYDIMRLIENS